MKLVTLYLLLLFSEGVASKTTCEKEMRGRPDERCKTLVVDPGENYPMERVKGGLEREVAKVNLQWWQVGKLFQNSISE